MNILVDQLKDCKTFIDKYLEDLEEYKELPNKTNMIRGVVIKDGTEECTAIEYIKNTCNKIMSGLDELYYNLNSESVDLPDYDKIEHILFTLVGISNEFLKVKNTPATNIEVSPIEHDAYLDIIIQEYKYLKSILDNSLSQPEFLKKMDSILCCAPRVFDKKEALFISSIIKKCEDESEAKMLYENFKSERRALEQLLNSNIPRLSFQGLFDSLASISIFK